MQKEIGAWLIKRKKILAGFGQSNLKEKERKREGGRKKGRERGRKREREMGKESVCVRERVCVCECACVLGRVWANVPNEERVDYFISVYFLEKNNITFDPLKMN